jgi:hydroxyacylglutathione hydrolase
MNLEIEQFICRSDNFGVLLNNPADGLAAAIDAPEAARIERALGASGWRLSHILVTHSHSDHTAGIDALKSAHGCEVIGPCAEADRIPAIDRRVSEGDEIDLGGCSLQVLDVPGHSPGHVAYYAAEQALLFVGDVLFALGCGRVPEGSHATMWRSLLKLAALPRGTRFYCGHEYTSANARFALAVEPHNTDLQRRAAEVRLIAAEGRPTLPSTIGLELDTNPFLRAAEPAIKAALAMPDAPPEAVFTALRRRKDRF